MTQLVGQRTRKFAERCHPAQVSQLPPLCISFQFCELPARDVPDDAENLVAVASDNARLVESLRAFGAKRVFDLLGFVRAVCPRKPLHERLGHWRRQHFPDVLVEEGRRWGVEFGCVLDVVVEEQTVNRCQEHPVRDCPQDCLDARLAPLQRLRRALLLDRDAGDVGRCFDQPQLIVALFARLGVVHRKRTEHRPLWRKDRR